MRAAAIARENEKRSPGRMPFHSAVQAFKPASAERIKAYQEQQERWARQTRAVEAMQRRNLPERYANAVLSDVSLVPEDAQREYAKARDAVRRLIDRPALAALIGEPGTGKTHLACALINAFCQLGRTAVYVKAGSYVREINATYRRLAPRSEGAVEADYLRVSLLVIDEWTATRDTRSEFVSLFSLIDKRYDAKRATIIISNHLTVAEYDASMDDRVASRSLDDGGGVIPFNWSPIRGRTGGACPAL